MVINQTSKEGEGLEHPAPAFIRQSRKGRDLCPHAGWTCTGQMGKLRQEGDLDLCVWQLGRDGIPTAQATVNQELRQFSWVKQVSSLSYQQAGEPGTKGGEGSKRPWSSGLGPGVVSATQTLAQDAAPQPGK